MARRLHSVRNVGLTLAAAGVGVVAAGGMAAGDGVGGHLAEGTVTAVGANSFTLSTSKGTETIDTTASTTYRELGTPVAPTGVVDGQRVAVALNRTDSTPTAVSVTILLNRVSGQVTNVSGTTITLTAPGGPRQVTVSSSTAYFSGKNTATGVTDGEWVTAFGTRDSASTPPAFDALFVDILTAPLPIGSHPGPVFFGLFHGWAFGWWHRTGNDPVSPGALRQSHTTPAGANAPSSSSDGLRTDHAHAPRSGDVPGGGGPGGGHPSGSGDGSPDGGSGGGDS